MRPKTTTPKPPPPSCFQRLKRYWSNEGIKFAFLSIFIAANIALFAQSFLQFMNSKYFPVLSYGVCIAKASAACLRFVSAIMLFPVCRSFMSWLRGTWAGGFIPMDKNIVFHKLCAAWLAIATLMHTGAHLFNFFVLSYASLEELEPLGFTAVPTFVDLLVKSLFGLTGIAAVLVLFIMYAPAFDCIRRRSYERFWYTHHLFILYFVLISVHGLAAVFGPPQFGYWVGGPVVFYLIDRMIRALKRKYSVILVQAKGYPNRGMELRMKLPEGKFKYKPGQYLLLNCPYFNKKEWHPFTITSAPHDDFVSVHINLAGNWTGRLHTFLNPNRMVGICQTNVDKASFEEAG